MSNHRWIHPWIQRCDKCTGGRTRRQRRIDINDARPAWIEPDRNLGIRTPYFDLALAVECERARPTAQLDGLAVAEELSISDWYVTK